MRITRHLKDKVTAWAEFSPEGKKVQSDPHDTDQHGTHCAGVIAGGREGGSVIGVAPDARLAVALVLDGKKGGTDAQVLAGIDWLVEQEVDVISISLGGLTLDPETPQYSHGSHPDLPSCRYSGHHCDW